MEVSFDIMFLTADATSEKLSIGRMQKKKCQTAEVMGSEIDDSALSFLIGKFHLTDSRAVQAAATAAE